MMLSLGEGIGQKRLLECIALRPMDGYMAGNIQYDNALRKGGEFKDIAFVTSDIGAIHHFDSLTVFDYLYYCARLRYIFCYYKTFLIWNKLL